MVPHIALSLMHKGSALGRCGVLDPRSGSRFGRQKERNRLIDMDIWNWVKIGTGAEKISSWRRVRTSFHDLPHRVIHNTRATGGALFCELVNSER